VPKKTITAIFGFAVFFPTFALRADTFAFKKKGEMVKNLSFEELKKLIPVQKITVWDGNAEQDDTYKGIPMVPLLDVIYGKTWRDSEELLFTCLDGYQPEVPVEKFVQYPSYLTFEKEGPKEFKLSNKQQNAEVVDLAPFYLVWDNLKFPALKKTKGRGWPYQVTGIDIINFAERFPNLAPPSNASAKVKRGFLKFREKCVSCHTMNGEGGTKAVELNYPVNVTEYFKEKLLRKWITEPTSIRFNSTMPAIGGEGKERETIIDEILSYLHAMAKNKRAPTVQK
jgi:hypothetical protein